MYNTHKMNAYELFSQNIKEKEHLDCLKLLIKTWEGKQQLSRLIRTLTQQFCLNCQIDLSKVIIKKDNTHSIDVSHTFPNLKLQQNIPKQQLHQFMKYLFRNHYKQSQLFFNEEDSDKIDKWISGFSNVWFPEKQKILKVIRKIGEKEYLQLLLLPNHNTILTITNSNNSILLKKSSHLYFNQAEQLLLPNSSLYFGSQLDFIGSLDPVYFIPKGQGSLINQLKFFQFYSEEFYYTISNGYFKACVLQDIKIIKQDGFMKEGTSISEGKTSYIQKSIAYTDEFNITSQQTKTLFAGVWLNQISVDYVINKYYNEYKYIRQRNSQLNIMLIDTRLSQDIFSSQITQNEEINEELSQKILQDVNLKETRIIILLNVDRCHFISACIQNDIIYILNSMNSNEKDQKVGEQIRKFYQTAYKNTFQESNEFSKSNYQGSHQQSQFSTNINILPVPQQKNGYDCSIYTLFNSMQLIRDYDIQIEKINFQISPKQISELRFQIFQDFFNNNTIIQNKKSWSVNGGIK